MHQYRTPYLELDHSEDGSSKVEDKVLLPRPRLFERYEGLLPVDRINLIQNELPIPDIIPKSGNFAQIHEVPQYPTDRTESFVDYISKCASSPIK